MVYTRQPQSTKAAHPLVAREDVHERVLESVPHVKRAGDVWRRNGDGEHWSVRVTIYFGSKVATRLPSLVMMLFGLLGVVLFRDVHQLVSFDSCSLCAWCFVLCAWCFVLCALCLVLGTWYLVLVADTPRKY